METTQSEALREASKDLAAAREAEAAGEGKAAEYQEERIRFEQQKRLAAIDAHFAARGRHVIQGEGGRKATTQCVPRRAGRPGVHDEARLSCT